MVRFLNLNILYVFYALLWIKYEFMNYNTTDCIRIWFKFYLLRAQQKSKKKCKGLLKSNYVHKWTYMLTNKCRHS